jgi:hypothetical protein
MAILPILVVEVHNAPADRMSESVMGQGRLQRLASPPGRKRRPRPGMMSP